VTDLTKWPLLLVTGQPVTEEQANEILIRTVNPWVLAVNDRAWNATVARILGIELNDHGHFTHGSITEACERLKTIELEFLYNSRVSSAWIGGPHGWCDWDGRIGCSNYNIGKWPDAESVTEEWQRIAEAFPYLDLTAQLVTGEGAGELAAEWRIVAGHAEHQTPGEQIAEHTPLSDETILGRFLGFVGERGVSEDRLSAAVAQVREGARNA